MRILYVISLTYIFALGYGLSVAAQGKYVFTTEVRPFVTTKWGQDEPYNMMCPKEKRDTVLKHALAGCGPIVMAQAMCKYGYPPKNLKTGVEYKWQLMFDMPDDSTTTDEKKAVARLIKDCGTAASTVYGKSASATKINNVVTALKEYFGYSQYMSIADRLYYKGDGGNKAWKDKIQEELKGGRPIIIRAERNAHDAHVFIIDGCRDSVVHVNWGWSGKRDGYYDPDSLDGYMHNQRMIVGTAPSGYRPAVKRIVLDKAGDLARHITDKDWLYTRHIKIAGTVNKNDFELLRQLAGGGRDGERKGNLCTIDLNEAVTLALPDSAFYGCDNLTYVSLPITLPAISRYCFAKCGKLNGVMIHNMVNSIGQNAFSGCFGLIKIELPKSLRHIGANAFNSCTTIKTIVVPAHTKTIGSGAFAHCVKLSRLYMPKALKKTDKTIIVGTKVKRINRI
ncbi:C10 family peptidase [Xylanibacter muris]|uniref:Leucine-rich repeat protein n=1 Tax=Xylanibacter muris TaxID=2736290 RepID=A0ABX2AKC5_9BACT|nr:C10 family peptidase [Xylanibacter muris]NPD90992.1 leucine-rich repeat protein [Xylanibacter muris]